MCAVERDQPCHWFLRDGFYLHKDFKIAFG